VSIGLISVWDLLRVLRLTTAWRWAIQADKQLLPSCLGCLCAHRRLFHQSASPSSLLRKFRQLLKAPPSKRMVLPAVPEGTSVVLPKVLAGSADIPEPLGVLAAGCPKQRQLLFCLGTFSRRDDPKRLCHADYCEKRCAWEMGSAGL
jgi:hypothetical protein